MSDVLSDLTPFGNPDGSRAHLDEITKGFVDFGNASAWGGLSTPPDDLSARILVGRKGSGKTLYLRRLRAHASSEESLYADLIQQDHIATSNVIKFCQWFPQAQLNEKWMMLWRRAILRSVVSHLLCNQMIQRPASQTLRARLDREFPSAVRNFRAPVSVYNQATSILHENPTRASLEKYFNDGIWNELESVLASALTDFPPICLYIDAVDEEFEAAPKFWLQCQKGLFYECMRLLRDASFGNRLHLVICIRDIVLSSVYHSEHQTRYIGEPHIRVLNWNRGSISYFLGEKIARLPKFLLADQSRSGQPVVSWLGMATIPNIERKIIEPIEQYLLRHTRLLPRDIVLLGNLLCQAISRAKAVNNGHDIASIVRATVSSAARRFGNEQLLICANEFVSSSMPKHAAQQGYEEAYTANPEYSMGVFGQLKTLISCLKKDRFSRDEMTASRSAVEELFMGQVDLWSILWRNGLLGYVEGKGASEKHIFYSDDRIDEFTLPLTMQTYLLHPTMIDVVPIDAAGSTPVLPFNNGEV